MSVAAFVILAFMIAAYALLDGYDLGVAAIAPIIGRTPNQRSAAMEAIGPFWNGNEVWLIAAGGALFALFPQAYASAFSGFYLPFMVVLWLLMFRGIALELRNHLSAQLWQEFWDVCFTLSSTLLILLFGVAIGNLLRGVPLDRSGYFVGSFAFLLNPYAVAVGLFAIATLAMHGAVFLSMRLSGLLAERSRKLVIRLWPLVLVIYLGVTVATYFERSNLTELLSTWIVALPVLSLAALIFVLRATRHAASGRAFIASSLFVGSLVAAAAAAMFPYLLPGFPHMSNGLSIYAAAPSPISLTTALIATVAGIIVVVAYSVFVTRLFPRRISGET